MPESVEFTFFLKKRLLFRSKGGIITVSGDKIKRRETKQMFENWRDAYADRWEEEQAEMAWYAEQEAQYAEDRKNFLEAMDALYEE